jgi:hypothetical protein
VVFAAAWGSLYGSGVFSEALQLDSTAELAATPAVGDMVGRVRHWNEISIDASGLDHTPNGVGGPHEFGEQLGPGRAARAMAIVHIAIFEAVNSVVGGYRELSRAAARTTAGLPSTRRSRRRRTTRWPRCFLPRGQRSARSSIKIWRP